VAVRSKARICGGLFAGFAGSNPDDRNAYLSVVFAVCCVVSGLCYTSREFLLNICI